MPSALQLANGLWREILGIVLVLEFRDNVLCTAIILSHPAYVAASCSAVTTSPGRSPSSRWSEIVCMETGNMDVCKYSSDKAEG